LRFTDFSFSINLIHLLQEHSGLLVLLTAVHTAYFHAMLVLQTGTVLVRFWLTVSSCVVH